MKRYIFQVPQKKKRCFFAYNLNKQKYYIININRFKNNYKTKKKIILKKYQLINQTLMDKTKKKTDFFFSKKKPTQNEMN